MDNHTIGGGVLAEAASATKEMSQSDLGKSAWHHPSPYSWGQHW